MVLVDMPFTSDDVKYFELFYFELRLHVQNTIISN